MHIDRAVSNSEKPFRVLSIDGGGMRGLFVSEFLKILAQEKGKQLCKRLDDIGKPFDLITGTSTGGLIACALANGNSIDSVIDIYKNNGKLIFPSPTPSKTLSVIFWVIKHFSSHAANSGKLRESLQSLFGGMTLKELYEKRNKSLCITSVDLELKKPIVFKTPHKLLASEYPFTRDRDYSLVDVCLSTSAAPFYFSPYALKHNDSVINCVDGGLWANNPVEVALIEAMQLAQPAQTIEIISIGTCPPDSSNILKKKKMGFKDWRMGADVLTLSLDVQSMASYNKTEQLIKIFNSKTGHKIIHKRWPRTPFATSDCEYMQLDRSCKNAQQAMFKHARNAVNEILSTENEVFIDNIFSEMEVTNG